MFTYLHLKSKYLRPSLDCYANNHTYAECMLLSFITIYLHFVKYLISPP